MYEKAELFFQMSVPATLLLIINPSEKAVKTNSIADSPLTLFVYFEIFDR